MPPRTKVLFLCIGNACRSQMAEAIARHHASDVIEASSAGLVPFGAVPDITLTVLGERGIPVEGLRSKALSAKDISDTDLVINMTGRAGSEFLTDAIAPVEDWHVGDPFGLNLTMYRAIRGQIEALVEDLARRLRNKDAPTTPESRSNPAT